MQLGSRWRVNEPPHRSVPFELHETIREQEQQHPHAHSWTLTWLEGRPRCDLDGTLIVTLSREGAVQVIPSSQNGDLEVDDDDDDDWLA